MDNFARMPAEERQLYFEQTAAKLGISAQIIEKDFWVCWGLKRLFSIDEFRNHLTFKGGTSLSKVFSVIERFSEDVDVSIERSLLGFGGDNEPEQASSGKEQKRRIERLQAACRTVIAERLTPQFRSAVEKQLGETGAWGLHADPAGQSLLFQFPAAITTGLSPYFAATVKIELGARSDHFPVQQATVQPYVIDAFPDAMNDSLASIRVLGAERTFWKK